MNDLNALWMASLALAGSTLWVAVATADSRPFALMPQDHTHSLANWFPKLHQIPSPQLIPRSAPSSCSSAARVHGELN